MIEPIYLEIKRNLDDRGILDQIYEYKFPFKIKRIYVTMNDKGTIRGFHGHLHEGKVIYVPQGRIKVLSFNMKDKEKPAKLNTFVLDEKVPRILYIPETNYHGYITLSSESKVIILSDKTLEESEKDDYRLDALSFGEGIWQVKHR